MAGRRLTGIGQLLLAIAGFLMVVAWFVLLAVQSYQELINDAPPKSLGWLGLAGAAVFAVAWLWSLVTSLSILREGRTSEPNQLQTPRS